VQKHYQSMRIVVIIAVCWFFISGMAETTDTTQRSLPEIEIVASRPCKSLPYGILVGDLQSLDISRLPVFSLADYLSFLPMVDIRARGGNGSQADISMRGGTFDQVQILLNGVAMGDAQTGHYQFNLPLSTNLIERIDILQGACVGISGAFLGAINIVTKDADSACNTIELAAGMNQLLSSDWTGRWHLGGWRLSASATYSCADGYIAPNPTDKESFANANSGNQWTNIYLRSTYRGLDMQCGFQYKDAGLGMGYGFGSQDQFDATRTGITSIKYDHSWHRFTIVGCLSYRVNYDRYEWHRGTISNIHLTQNVTASFLGNYKSSVGLTSTGVELKNENIKSTNLKDTNRLNIHYYARQTINYQSVSLLLGIGGHYNSLFGNNVTGTVLGNYRFSTDGEMHIQVDRAIRLPTFTDLYYNAGNQLGNPNLKEETAWILSLGSHWSHRWLKAGQLKCQVNVYYRWGRNLIDWVYVPTDAIRPFHAENQQKVDAYGGELLISYRFNDWLRCIRLEYAYTSLLIDLNQSQSRYLNYLRHKLIVRLEHGIYHGLGASWALRYEQREGQYNDSEGQVRDYSPACLLDGELFYEVLALRVGVSCTNIMNCRYYSYGGVLQPGAWLKFKLRVTW